MYAILITGAALVGLPIILHLIMKQEPKRLLFPAVRFLQQKQRTNQRKMRLRHFLLLLLRCLLIALFCAALIQPKVPSAGLVNLQGDAPVAAVLILDTSPSMGYTAEGKTRIDEARRRALELLDGLPTGSKVAVVDPADPIGTWELSVGDARRKVEGFKQPRGGGPPVTTALLTAYQLLKTVDQESEASEPMARLVVVFSDRTDACWKADQSENLKKAAEQVPPPAVAHLFVDVGVEQPANVAVIAADARPQLSRAGSAVTLTVTAQATGPDVPSAVVRCVVDGGPNPERKEIVPLPAGTPKAVTFTLKDLPPGWHQATVSLETPDALEADNTRSVTFRVGEARRILTISDDPDDAAFWRIAHREKGDFACEVKTPAQATDFAGYEAVCLLSVANPADGGLWQRLGDYVKRGGKVLVIPGGELDASAYAPEASGGLLPGKLARVVTGEATWVTDREARRRHQFLAPFEAWEQAGNIDFIQRRPRVFRFWEVEGYTPEQVVVNYTAVNDQSKPYPAVLEKTFPGGGKVLLLTTRLDTPWPEFPERKAWHEYWETALGSWPSVFPHLLVTYLAGNTADANYSYTTGQAVAVPLRPGGGLKGKKLVFEGPGLSGTDAEVEVGENQTELRLGPGRTLTAGNFLLRTEDRSWQEGFALNLPAEESNLGKVPKEAVEALFGPDAVLPVEKDLKLGEILTKRFDPELRLFPWLLIGVLVLFAVEGLVANRFYRVRRS